MKKKLLEVSNLALMRGSRQVLSGISFVLHSMETLAVIGAQGAGQEDLLRSLMGIQSGALSGKVSLYSEDKIGLVSSAYPCASQLTIFENLSLTLKLMGVNSRAFLGEEVEGALKAVDLWGEVRSALHEQVKRLSYYQRVRLNVARTLLLKPSVLLLEHPGVTLDPLQKAHYEAIIERIKGQSSVIWVTNDLEQAARVSDSVLFLKDGQMVEWGSCEDVFTMPQKVETENFISRRVYV